MALCSSSVEMSTTVMSATESQPAVTKPTAPTTEADFVECDCCGLTEECTPAYIERIRERYQGKWICGLCGEAVKDETVRAERLISTEEAMARHMTFCRKPRSSSPPPDPAVHLIAAVRQILRRSSDSPRSLSSMPTSPTAKKSSTGILRSESCIPKLTLVVDCRELEEDGE